MADGEAGDPAAVAEHGGPPPYRPGRGTATAKLEAAPAVSVRFVFLEPENSAQRIRVHLPAAEQARILEAFEIRQVTQ